MANVWATRLKEGDADTAPATSPTNNTAARAPFNKRAKTLACASGTAFLWFIETMGAFLSRECGDNLSAPNSSCFVAAFGPLVNLESVAIKKFCSRQQSVGRVGDISHDELGSY